MSDSIKCVFEWFGQQSTDWPVCFPADAVYLLISGSRFGFKFITIITIGMSLHSSKIVILYF